MPRKQRNELKAGIFVIASMAILLGVVLWLGASSIFERPTGRAVFYVSNDAGPVGLKEDFEVMVNDVNVGKIVEVRPDFAQKRTLYFVEFLQKGFEVHTDGKAQVSAGLLGQGVLAIISPGTNEKPLADEDHPVQISGGIQEIIDNMKKLSETMQTELDAKNDASLLFSIKAVVAQLLTASQNISKMTTDLGPELDPKTKDTIAANLKETMSNLASTSEKIDGYVKKDLGELLVKIREIANSVLKAANDLAVSSEQIKQLLVINHDNIDEMVDNMVLVSANLKATSTEIRRNPWRLFYKPDEKKMHSTNIYDAARAFDEGAQQLDLAVAKLKAVKQLDPEDPATIKEVQRLRKHLLETFKKFQKVEDALWKEVSQ